MGAQGPKGDSGVTATYGPNGQALASTHVTFGAAKLQKGSATVKFVGNSVFSSNTTFFCNLTQLSGNAVLRLANTADPVGLRGQEFVVTAGNDSESEAEFNYFCIGY